MKKLLLLIAAAIVSMAVNADPITVYVQKDAPFTITNIYAFNGGTSLPTSEGTVGCWPGVDITGNSTAINGVDYYYYTFDEAITTVSVIFNNGGNTGQTNDITGISSTTAYKITGTSNKYNFETVDITMATPVISVSGYSVSITCADTEAQIYYTLDGTEPTASSTLYEGAFDITETKTVKAIAIRDGFTSSAIAEETVTPTDPSTAITVYVQKKDGFTKIYAWYKDSEGNTQEPCGSWGGAVLTVSETVAEVEYWKYTFDASITSVNVIFNGDSGQTTNIEGITETTYYQILDEKDGSGHYKWETVTISTSTKVETPTLFQYMNNVVKLECATAGATIHYYYGDEEISKDNWTDYTAPFLFNETKTIKAIATCDGLENSDAMVVEYTPYTYDEGAITVGVKIPDAPFTPSHIYAWTDGVEYIDKAWPGHEFTDNEKVYIDGVEYYCYVFDPKYTSVSVIFNNNSGSQTVDITDVTGEAYYEILSDKDGSKYKITFLSDVSEVEDIITDNIVTENVQIEYYNLYGIKIENPQHGIYIRKCGNKTEKVVL
ncbi:MAG: starch-binding protein [Muribaculaceae bacterium]